MQEFEAAFLISVKFFFDVVLLKEKVAFSPYFYGD